MIQFHTFQKMYQQKSNAFDVVQARLAYDTDVHIIRNSCRSMWFEFALRERVDAGWIVVRSAKFNIFIDDRFLHRKQPRE